MKKKRYSSSPYDDVFKTLLLNLPDCLIWLVNEMFGYDYKGNEKVRYSNNELYIRKNNSNTKRITDSSFYIIKDNIEKHYHIECQSYKDKSMLIRMIEYDIQLALQNKEFINSNTLSISFPKSGILYLRSDSSIPDLMKIVLNTPNGSIEYEINVLKVKDYEIKDIFEKKLYFLIPFYIFIFDDEIDIINNDKKKLNILKSRFEELINNLNYELDNKTINEYTYITIINLMRNIVEPYTNKYNEVRQEVLDTMYGKEIELEFIKLYKQNRAEGIAEGRTEGITEVINKMVAAGDLDEETAKKYLPDTNEKSIKTK